MNHKLSAQKHSADIQCFFLRNLANYLDQDSVLQEIVENVTAILKASACSIYIVDDTEGYPKSATQRAGDGHQKYSIGIAKCVVIAEEMVNDANPSEDEKLGITGWILSTGKSFLARTWDDVVKHPHRLGTHDPDMSPDKQLKLQTFLGVPIRGIHGEIIGVLKAERRYEQNSQNEPFSVDEQIILETVARVTSKSIKYLETARTRSLDAAITAWSRDVISEASITENDLDGFLSLVVDVVSAAMNADSCGIFLTDPHKNTLTQRAGNGSQKTHSAIRSYRLPKKEQIVETPQDIKDRVGLTAWIAATGKSFCAANIDQLRSHAHHLGAYDSLNFEKGKEICGAFLGGPLQVAGDIVGTLKVENISIFGEYDSREFNKEAQRRFDILAQDIALAIVRLQIHATDPYRVIMNAQETIFQILRGGHDVKTLVNTVVTKTMELLNARACALFLKEGNRLIQPEWAAAGYARTEISPGEQREYVLVSPDDIIENPTQKSQKVALTVWIAIKRKKFTARSYTELKLHPHHRGTFDGVNFDKTKSERCESFMGVPLEVGDELVGVLKVESKKKITDINKEEYTYFSEQDELVFDLIAKSAAIAIENAKLSESRRFAEQIAVQSDRVLQYLHDFVNDNSQAVETLTQAAKLIRGEKEVTANIVENYAALLNPAFPERSLDAIANLIRPNIEFLILGRAVYKLYSEFSRALTDVDSVEALAQFCTTYEIGADIHLMQSQSFLNRSATLLSDTVAAVKKYMHSNQFLPNTRIFLEKIKLEVSKLPLPEKWIMGRIIDKWLIVIQKAAESFSEVDNPYIIGVPVDPAKSPFFGRHDMFVWVIKNMHTASQKNILVLHGEKRIGKTSILLQLERGDLGREFRENPHLPNCPVFIDLQSLSGAKSTASFLEQFSGKIAGGVGRQKPAIAHKIELPATQKFIESPFNAFQDFISKLCSLLENTLLVLMLDEFEQIDVFVKNKDIDESIFIQLRHLMQHQSNLAFIMAGSIILEELSGPYQQLLHSIALIREVSYMSKEDSFSLIRQPVLNAVTYEDEAAEGIWHLTNGHPYLIQLLCHSLIENMNKLRKNTITRQQLPSVVDKVIAGRSGTYLNTLWSTGCIDIEKAILHQLAFSSDKNGNLTKRDLFELLTGFGEVEVSNTLVRLLKRGLIVQNSDEKYKHAILLFSKWIQKNVPIEHISKWIKKP